MKNFVQPGKTLTLPAPSGGVIGGNAYLIGAIFVVANHSAAEGQPFDGDRVGVFTLPKEAPLVVNLGDKLYWDNTNKRLTKTSSGNTLVAAATVAALSADTTVPAVLTGQVA